MASIVLVSPVALWIMPQLRRKPRGPGRGARPHLTGKSPEVEPDQPQTLILHGASLQMTDPASLVDSASSPLSAPSSLSTPASPPRKVPRRRHIPTKGAAPTKRSTRVATLL